MRGDSIDDVALDDAPAESSIHRGNAREKILRDCRAEESAGTRDIECAYGGEVHGAKGEIDGGGINVVHASCVLFYVMQTSSLLSSRFEDRLLYTINLSPELFG